MMALPVQMVSMRMLQMMRMMRMMRMSAMLAMVVHMRRQMAIGTRRFGHLSSAAVDVLVGVIVVVVAVGPRIRSARHLLLVQLRVQRLRIVDIVTVIGPRTAGTPSGRCHHLSVMVLSDRIGR